MVKPLNFDPAKQEWLTQGKVLLKDNRLYLLALVIGSAFLHLLIVWKFTQLEQLQSNRLLISDWLSFVVPFWASVALLIWQRRKQHIYNTSLPQNLLALLLFGWVVVRTITLSWFDVDFLVIGPFLMALSLGLLAFGFKGMQPYWLRLLLLCLMVIPVNTPFLDSWFHISQITTVISAFLLHYLGQKATYEGVYIFLPNSQVSVAYQCTGGPLSLILLKVSLLIGIVFPLTWSKKLGLALSAIGTAFTLGVIRVAFLAFIVNNKSLFAYWHGSKGSQIFLTLGTIAFVALCNWLIPTEESTDEESEEKETSQDFNQPSISADKLKWYLPMLMTTGLGVALAAIYIVFTPNLIRKVLANNIFAENISLNNWQQVEVKSVDKPKLKDVENGFDGILAAKQYKYVKDNQNIDVRLLYVVNTGLNLDAIFKQLIPTKDKDIQKNIKQINNIGYYAVTNDGVKGYLTACINPRGGSTVTPAQFMQNRQSSNLNLSRILPWLFGKELLSDERCVLVQLSTPLQGKTASETYQFLESVWSVNYTTWQSRFPSP